MKNARILYNSYLSLSGFPQSRSLKIMQSDSTELTFDLKDINNEPIQLGETTGQVQLVHSERDELVFVTEASINGSSASFVIDEILPAAEYEVYIRINGHYFPSTQDSFILDIIPAYDVVEDFDFSDVTTIDLIVQALREDVVNALSAQIEGAVDNVINSNSERFKGEKGDTFTIHDFTEADWERIKGEPGENLVWENLSQEQINEMKLSVESYLIDEDGNTIISFSEGEDVIVQRGAKGEDGKGFTYVDFTPEQLDELRGEDGNSAYQIAIDNGFVGSETEWVESLNGRDGIDGESFDYESLTEEQKTEVRGPQGAPGKDFTFGDFTPEQLEQITGKDGEDGKDGQDADILAVTDNGDGTYNIVLTDSDTGQEISNYRIRDGIDGSKLESAVIDEEGNTVVTMTDGNSFIVEKGDKGDKGEDGFGTEAQYLAIIARLEALENQS